MANNDDFEKSHIGLLVGKTITRVEYFNFPDDSPGNDYLIFYTKNETFYYNVLDECCSYSWIESIDNKECLIGEKVLRVVSKFMSDESLDSENPERAARKIYNIDLITRKGTCTIDLRNDSNGYYGGYLELDFDHSILNDNTKKRIYSIGLENFENLKTRIYNE